MSASNMTNWDRYWSTVDRLTDRATKATKNAGKDRDDLEVCVIKWLERRIAQGKGYSDPS